MKSGIRATVYRLLGDRAGSMIHRMYRCVISPFRPDLTGEEEMLLQHVSEAVRPGDAVIDVGAHTGAWSRRLSGIVGPDGTVIAFEPVPSNLAVLERRTSRLANVVCLGSALSDSDGQAEILVPVDTYRPSTGALEGTADQIADHTGLKKLTVRTQRLDGIAAGLLAGRRLSLIKCDVEGHELQVLHGSIETVRTHLPVVVLEILREKWENGDPCSSGPARLLEGLGYTIAQVSPSGLVQDPNDFDPRFENFLFTPGTGSG